MAEVQLGPALRRGVAELDGKGEAVGGIVVMRYGENALDVIDAVKERLAEVQPSLPAGVRGRHHLRPLRADRGVDRHPAAHADRGDDRWCQPGHLPLPAPRAERAGPDPHPPVAVLLAFIPMLYQGLTINIMSLGGIAVAIGAMVDASIIIIENIHKRLEAWEGEGRPGAARRGGRSRAMQEVGPSIFFSLLVITVAFLPVFTLEATEGRLFKPLAFTKTYSMGFAAILAVTLTPALAALFSADGSAARRATRSTAG